MCVPGPCSTAGERRGAFDPGGVRSGAWRGGPFARRLGGAAIAAMSLLGAFLSVLALSPVTAAAGIGADQATIGQLEQRIAAQGAQVQSLVSRSDRVAGRLAAIKRQIAHYHARLVDDHRAEARATVRLRHVAVDAYVTAVSGNSTTFASLTSSTNVSTLPEQEVYAGIASGTLGTAMTALQVDQHRTATTQSALRDAQARTASALGQLASARKAAQAAIGADEAMLSHVRGNLRALVIVASDRRMAAKEQASEQALASASAQQPAPQQATAVPVPPPVHVVPGVYANPLRSVSGLTSERIDQGVDFNGFGPVYAIGDGVVLSTVNAGWPGGTFVAYRLTDGRGAGLVVYVAEDVNPAVQPGQSVTPGTVLGQMYGGPDGIETGWADASALGSSMASNYAQFDGSNSTAFGFNFSQLLQSVGGPGGVAESAPTGALPSGWPQW
jgi:murein DD-endopeptidase MepM/ murein hydrolase activator NlpD